MGFSLGVCSVTFLFSQTNEMKSKIRIKGTVVGMDRMVASENLTYSKKQQIFVVKVNMLQKGKEKSPYIKVIYKYDGDFSRLLQN